ncbi:DUF86 domain-containing protein [Exiguobacterium flavidum]|uniref:DUF86 domain-containing protein n=1 Tax=Exiguobacterium flavidum TaxID=2184695 RepID=UPI000DF828EF|nr:DUF86 domain-containing protein [Exiguobacterium flavidum]
MYFVDREKIEQALKCYEAGWAKRAVLSGDETTRDLAVERIGFLLIESVIDVGNSVIDGFIMRDPGSYEDIIEILEDEKVVDGPLAESLKRLVALRTLIVRSFVEASAGRVDTVLDMNEQQLKRFPQEIRRYLETELGPVSAFLPIEE